MESAQVAVLQRLLRIGVVAENGARSAEQRPVVAPHQRLEGAHIAAGDTLRELAVRKRLGAGWDCGGDDGFQGHDGTLDDAPSRRVPNRRPDQVLFFERSWPMMSIGIGETMVEALSP